MDRLEAYPTGMRNRSLSLFLSLIFLADIHAQQPDPEPLVHTGTLRFERVTESSGLCRSSALPDAFWTVNDSGAKPEMFLFDQRGRVRAVCEMKSAKNVDFESMTSMHRKGKHFLVVADVGDNVRKRKAVQLYLAAEPASLKGVSEATDDGHQKEAEPARLTITPTRIDFQYVVKDGDNAGRVNVDCEAAAFDQRDDCFYFIEKVFGLNKKTVKRPGQHPRVFRLDWKDIQSRYTPSGGPPVDDFSTEPAVATNVATFPHAGATGMTISPDGTMLAVSGYLQFWLYRRSVRGDDANRDGASGDDASGEAGTSLKTWGQIMKAQSPTALPLPLQRQCEAICFTRDSKSLVVTSEGVGQPIWKINLEPLQRELENDRE